MASPTVDQVTQPSDFLGEEALGQGQSIFNRSQSHWARIPV
jgi:hypothetical protein